MPKKRKVKKVDISFRKEKDLYKLINDPKAFKRMMDLNKSINEVHANMTDMNKKFESLLDWYNAVIRLIPDQQSYYENFKHELLELITKYDENKD